MAILIQNIDSQYLKVSDKMKYVDSGETMSGKGNSIDWNDFNYPCLVKIYHYTPEETPEIHRRRVALLRLNHTLIILATFFNIIANIAGAAQGVKDGGIRLAISFFLFFLWFPLAFQLLFYPYHIIMKDEGKPFIFYILSAFATVWFFIWCIADFADANGFIMVDRNFKSGKGAAGFFGLITSLKMLAVAILAIINMVMFYKR